MRFNVNVANEVLERDGAWVDWVMVDGVSVKMTRIDSTVNQKRMSILRKKNRKSFGHENMLKELMTKFMVDHIIVDWKGIVDEDKPKESFEYSKENASKLLNAADDFYIWVLGECSNIYNFEDADNPEDDTTVEERGNELKK